MSIYFINFIDNILRLLSSITAEGRMSWVTHFAAVLVITDLVGFCILDFVFQYAFLIFRFAITILINIYFCRFAGVYALLRLLNRHWGNAWIREGTTDSPGNRIEAGLLFAAVVGTNQQIFTFHVRYFGRIWLLVLQLEIVS